ncbi:MAG: zinc ribbon domain-containing protein [Oscillospiraceae bacterium]|jgi:hypothetical protein|nr:zinc ribbon domain-containing protein [Oscillospiraceae bacterium]
MSLLENAYLGAKSFFSKAGKGAEKLVGVSKLKMNAAEINSQISSKLEELGRIIYTNYKNKTNKQGEISELVKTIDKLHLDRQEIRKKIAVIKRKIECKECRYVNESDSAFCAQCGSKLSIFEVSDLQMKETGSPEEETAPDEAKSKAKRENLNENKKKTSDTSAEFHSHGPDEQDGAPQDVAAKEKPRV